MALKLKRKLLFKIHSHCKIEAKLSLLLSFDFRVCTKFSQSLAPLVILRTKNTTNTAGKAFEHQQTLNASEYVIFLVNLRIVLNFRDCCNLKF